MTEALDIYEIKANQTYKDLADDFVSGVSMLKSAGFSDFFTRYIFDPKATKFLQNILQSQAGKTVQDVQYELLNAVGNVPSFWSLMFPLSRAGRVHIFQSQLDKLALPVTDPVSKIPASLVTKVPYYYYTGPVAGTYLLYSSVGPRVGKVLFPSREQLFRQERLSDLAFSTALGGLAGSLTGAAYNLLRYNEEERNKKFLRDVLLGGLGGAGLGALLSSFFTEDKPF